VHRASSGTPREVFCQSTNQVQIGMNGPNSKAKKQKNGTTHPQFDKSFDKFLQSQNAISGISPRAMNQRQLNLKQPQFNMNNGYFNNQNNWANNQDNTRMRRGSQNIFNQSNGFAQQNQWNCNHGGRLIGQCPGNTGGPNKSARRTSVRTQT
jgi:hypothetical protein